MNKNILGALVFFSLVFGLSACQFRQEAAVQGTPESALYTQAAETVIAQLTKNAVENVGNQTQQPEATLQPAVAVTATPAEVSAAESTLTNTPDPTSTSSPSEPTATLTPTATQIPPTPTTSGDDIVKSLGIAAWLDDFNNGDNWSFTSDDRTSMEVKEGNAVLIATKPDYYYGWALTWPKPDNFYLEMTVKTGQECSGQDKYGLIFRSVKPSEGYLLGFTCDGQYRVWYYNGSDEVIIKDWEKSEKILEGVGQTNRVGIKAVGNNYTVYANGIELVSFSDDHQVKGSFGLMVGSVNTTNFTVYVDKITYWEIK